MSVLTTNFVGQQGVNPRKISYITTDSYAQITTPGYFDMKSGILPTDFVFCCYGTNNSSFEIFVPSISSGVMTLNPWIAQGNVTLPVTSGDFACFSGTTGLIADLGYLPSNAAKTTVVMANAATVANHIMVSTDTAGTSGNKTGTAINDGNLQAGRDTVAGTLISFPATTATGSLIIAGISNSGAFNTTVSNAAMGQSSVITIPDPGATTANFLLDTGTSNVLTDYQDFISLTNILINSVGTWTRTRVAQGNYSLVHTVADDTSVIGIDITPNLRAAASKGFKLSSIDVIYTIATNALDAHTLTFQSVAYANNVAVAVTNVPLTGSLSTATQANPYVTNLTVTTPSFFNTACAKYNLELTVNNSATSVYSFYGLNLHFSQTVA